VISCVLYAKNDDGGSGFVVAWITVLSGLTDNPEAAKSLR